MIETLTQLDHALTVTINHFHTPWLDTAMIAISGRLTWLPLYALLLFLFYRKLGWKNLVFALVAVGLTIVLCDQISVAFKNSFERLRPCHHLEISTMLHLADGCGGRFGFISSHAANTMGLAVFAGSLLYKNGISLVLLLFALLNSYSRVYLGKHYVADVVCGMLFGALVGYAVFVAWRAVARRYGAT